MSIVRAFHGGWIGLLTCGFYPPCPLHAFSFFFTDILTVALRICAQIASGFSIGRAFCCGETFREFIQFPQANDGIVLSRVLGCARLISRFWIDARMYCTVIQLVTALHKPLYDTVCRLFSFISDCHLRRLPQFYLPVSEWVILDRRSVGQSVLVSSTHLRLTTRFLLLSDSCGFVDVGRPLWREDGCVFYYAQYTICLHFTCYLALFIH
jgi:hypothetical protein